MSKIEFPDASALVLAGGKSSRMGIDKAQLPFDKKQTMLERTIEVIRRAAPVKILVSRNSDLSMHGCKLIPDQIPSKGPLSGIHAAINYVETEFLLVVPVDMPGLQPDLLVSLFTQKRSCFFDRFHLPCVLAMNPMLGTCLQAILTEPNGNYSLKRLLSSIDAVPLPTPEHLKVQLMNTNTPEDWRYWKEQGQYA